MTCIVVLPDRTVFEITGVISEGLHEVTVGGKSQNWTSTQIGNYLQSHKFTLENAPEVLKPFIPQEEPKKWWEIQHVLPDGTTFQFSGDFTESDPQDYGTEVNGKREWICEDDIGWFLKSHGVTRENCPHRLVYWLDRKDSEDP